ncbi:MAG: DUF6261 family protein, partial [Bacteroidales bacterium]|nr:DUF6261 family protein [Bacteroidales bacterium]
RKKKSDDTEIVDSLEESRDNTFKSFTFTVRGFKLRADKDLSARGHQIFEIIKRHGISLYNLPNNEQTAKTKSLVDELKKPANMAAMEGTILLDLFYDVESSNQKYVDAVTKRAKNDADAEETALVVAARKKTRLALEHLINYLNSVSFIYDSAELKNLCKSIASVIDKTNANIHGRINKANNSEETE